LYFGALTTMVLIANSATATELVGIPRVVDGDTLTIGAAKVRLQGIDAPETDQICLNANGKPWPCGIEARDRLAAHIAKSENHMRFDWHRRLQTRTRSVQRRR
jgi:endonuclease YncB( thermonuclease family)